MPTIRTCTLDCGMPLIVEHIPDMRSVGVTLLLPAGAAADPPELQGMSAMWSHLLLRGAGANDSRAQADALDALGVSRGADVHTFSLEVSATLLGSRLPDLLPLLADIVLRPRMDPPAVDAVREICLQSIEALDDEPQDKAMVLLKERHAPPPWNRSGMGTPDGLRAITRERLLEGWTARARPLGAVLAVAGDARLDDLAPALNRLFRGWTGDAPTPAPGPIPPRGYSHVTEQTQQAHITIAHDAPPESHPDCARERVLAAVLSGGSSSRLFTEVREKRGLCYTVHATYGADRDFGRVSAHAGATPDRAQETLDVLWQELSRLTASGGGEITPDEHRRAVIGLRSRVIMSGESTTARAGALAQDWRKLGRPRSLDEISAAIDAVTLDDLHAYTRRRSLGASTVLTLGPAALRPPI